MYRFIALVPMALSAVLTAQEAENPVHFNELESGRYMQVLQVPEANSSILRGKAPDDSDGTYRILNGSTVIWEGSAGEHFELRPYSRKLYLEIGRAIINLQLKKVL